MDFTGGGIEGFFMAMKTYSEKLKDPRWQRKRLEILERDNWTCLDCGDIESTLHVHHCSYVYDREPWDYDESNFRTLCDECHESRHDCEKMAKSNFTFIMSHLSQMEIHRITMEMLGIIAIGGTIRAISESDMTPDQIKSADEELANPQ